MFLSSMPERRRARFGRVSHIIAARARHVMLAIQNMSLVAIM